MLVHALFRADRVQVEPGTIRRGVLRRMKQARPCCIRMRAREQLSAHIVRLRHSRCCCMYVWAHTSVRGIFSANVNLCVLRHCVVRVRSFRRRRFLYVNHSIPSACYKTLGLGQHHVQKPAPVGPCTKLKFRPGALIFAQAPAACPSQQTRTRAQVTISRPRSSGAVPSATTHSCCSNIRSHF